MNTTAILRAVDHRPWPLPTRPWVMTQIWHELLFAHWPLAPDALRPLVPAPLALDTFDNQAWVSIVPFRVSDARLRWLPPIPGLSQLRFPELNVRTYVTVAGIPGVLFFSLDAGNPLAVAVARTLFHLPYFNAAMHSQYRHGAIHYTSRRTHRGAPPAEYEACYRPTGPVTFPQPGTIEHWLTERYCLYTVVRQRVYRGDIHHRPWPLQPAELETRRDTLTRSHGIHLPNTPPPTPLRASPGNSVLATTNHRAAFPPAPL